MAFQDNSGDIILDAVLTQRGAQLMARGELTITKFALGDDEIDYAIYDKNSALGTPGYDINILETPILEALTYGDASLKHKLLNNPRTNLLYMPVMKLFNEGASALDSTYGTFLVITDSTTFETLTGNRTGLDPGKLRGLNPAKDSGGSLIRVDQGINSGDISTDTPIDPSKRESQFFIDIDSKFGAVVGPQGQSLQVSTIDAQNIGTYVVTLNSQGATQGAAGAVAYALSPGDTSDLLGPRGSRVQFRIQAGNEIVTSNDAFIKYGTAGTKAGAITNALSGRTLAAANYRFIDSMVRITGVTTGYRIAIPIRYVKQITS